MASILDGYRNAAFNIRKITVRFKDKFLGGIPAGGDPLDYWMKSKHMSEKDKTDFLTRIKEGDLTEEEKVAIKDTSRCVFERDKAGNICLWHGNWKAHLRDIATAQGLTQKRFNSSKENPSAGGKHMFQIKVQIMPLHINFTRDGKILKDPDGEISTVKHIEDAAGKRNALGSYEYVENAEQTLELYYPAGISKPEAGIFSEDDFKRLFAIGEVAGHGATKSQGRGCYEVIKWE